MRTVLEIDGLFDGTSAMSDAAVVIEDGEITWVGKRSRAPKTPKGEKSRTAPAPGGFAVPGLINCHSHLTLDGSANFEAETRESEAAAALKAFRNARLTLRSGVTTVRDLGANGAMVVELARQIERGALEGPRIIAAARGITITGGHGTEVGRIADGPDAVRAATRVAADVVGRPKAGRITAGSWADLVFVDGDPLRDLALLQKPKAVWVRGAPVG